MHFLKIWLTVYLKLKSLFKLLMNYPEKKERSNAIMCLPSYEIYNNCALIRLPSGFVVHGISKLFATYTVADAGTEFLLPTMDNKWLLVTDTEIKPLSNKQVTDESHHRKGKGGHVLNVAKELMSDKSNCYDIESSDDYNFPVIFTKPYPQRFGYCKDISKLPNYEVSDLHFIIQAF